MISVFIAYHWYLFYGKLFPIHPVQIFAAEVWFSTSFLRPRHLSGLLRICFPVTDQAGVDHLFQKNL
jgi:hypothetical protein